MFRTRLARRPCWATSQKVSPSRPSQMGVRRGCPVRRPVVSSTVYLSGQVTHDDRANILGVGDMEAFTLPRPRHAGEATALQ